ncbi:Uncharacterised protein r2_g1301 [Pycnogonum litorale]
MASADATYVKIMLTCIFTVLLCKIILATNNGGPIFVTRQKSTIEFLNKRGVILDCIAHGDPDPEIKWYVLSKGVEKQVTDIPSIRKIYSNGSLALMGFRPEQYVQDIHASVYRCSASNIHGRIVSVPTYVRAVSKQQQRIQAQVYDEYVIEGNTAVLKCNIPTFFMDDLEVIAWVREDNHLISPKNDGDEYHMVPGNGNLHVKFSSGSSIQQGYWCQVKNRVTGETFLSQTSGRIRLTHPQGAVPPVITDLSSTIYVQRGESIEISCAAQGHPSPAYRWKKPDGEFVSSESLVISETGKPGSFVYRCFVSNSNGEDSKSTVVIVTEPLNAYMEEERTDHGFELSCKVSGYPVDKMEWVHNGRPLNLSTTWNNQSQHIAKILIENVGRQDGGMYQCFVRNQFEIIQASQQLKRGDYSPSFQKLFESKTMQPGPSIELECSGIGQPTPNITWFRNGQILESGERTVIRKTIDEHGIVASKIIVKIVRTQDGGQYKCIIANKIGSKEAAKRINVYGLPVVHQMQNVTVAESQNVRLNCYVSGYPIRSIKWKRGNGNFLFLPRGRTKDYKNGTLEISNVVDRKDEGKYSCTAENGQGQSDQKSMFLNILVKPEIAQSSFTEVTLEEGAPFSSFCSVIKGDEPLTIAWFKNDSPIVLGLGTDIATTKMYSVLQIREVSAEDHGNYTCVSSNVVGNSSKTTLLLVSESPKWIISPQDTKTAIGTDVSFHCSSKGTPKPKAEWFKIQVLRKS